MRYIALYAGALLALASGPALAADALTTDAIHMYAGPNDNFPQVMRLSAGRPVTLHGCLASFEWCDVEWRGNRGWVHAGALATPDNVNVAASGPTLDVPRVRFDVRTYWEQNYQSRPWYADRDTWYQAIGTPRDAYPESTFRSQTARSE